MKILWHQKGKVWAGVTMKDRTAPENNNLALHVCQNEDDVRANRTRLEKETIPLDCWALPWQKHTDHICQITHEDKGKGSRDKETSILHTDAVWTLEPGILTGVFTADCCGILIVDETVPLAGAIHSGWKGTAKAITYKAVQDMIERGNLNPATAKAYFSPSILQDSLEVGMEVIEQIQTLKEYGIDTDAFWYPKGEKAYLDNQGLNAQMLKKLGFQEENIHLTDKNTKTETDCFSYRNEGTKTGEHFSFVWIKEGR